MRRALALAARAGGRTSPNPNVGALALDARSGQVLAEGFHRAPGEAHAEAALLRAASERGVDLRGATLVSTLEPCAHHGRTPPCAPLVASAGFARVVVATRDPNPLVNGRGIALLRRAGLEVEEGVLGREARRLNEGFRHWIATGRPFVHLKMAMLPDGTVYRGAGFPPGISGPEARRLVHVWRHLSPAVLTGSGTLRVDDPRLTVRELPPSMDVEPWQPRRVVLSTRFDVSLSARALEPSPGAPPPLVMGAEGARPAAVGVLEGKGVETVQVAGATGGGVDLRAALELLGSRGVTGVLVEAGPILADAFLAAELADRLSVFISDADRKGDAVGPRAEDRPGRPGRRRWTPPGGFPFTGQGLVEREEARVGPDRLITGLVRDAGGTPTIESR